MRCLFRFCVKIIAVAKEKRNSISETYIIQTEGEIVKWIDSFCSYCLKIGYVTEDRIPWLRYAIQKKYVVILIAIPFLITGVLLSSISTACTFLFSFYFLRTRTNGFHAKNIWSCFFISLVSEIIFLGVLPYIMKNTYIIGLLFLSAIYIWVASPAKCPNFVLTDSEMKACAISAKIRMLIIVSAWFIFHLLNNSQVSEGLAFGMIMTACGLAAAKINCKGEYL